MTASILVIRPTRLVISIDNCMIFFCKYSFLSTIYHHHYHFHYHYNHCYDHHHYYYHLRMNGRLRETTIFIHKYSVLILCREAIYLSPLLYSVTLPLHSTFQGHRTKTPHPHPHSLQLLCPPRVDSRGVSRGVSRGGSEAWHPLCSRARCSWRRRRRRRGWRRARTPIS